MKTLQSHGRALVVLLLLVAAYGSLWSYDPVVARVRQRFPAAVIHDDGSYRWLVPPVLRSRVEAAEDPLLDGTYLRIELSDQTVDLHQLIDVPFYLVILTRCRVPDLSPVDAMHLGNRSIQFRACDLADALRPKTDGLYRTPSGDLAIGGP